MDSTTPTPEQLTLINQYTASGMPPLEDSEVATITFIATDNLLTRSLGKWAVEDLSAIAQLLPGLPFTLDHDWDNVGKSQGIVYDSRVVTKDEAPRWAVDRAGNNAQNQQIINQEGYVTVEADVAFPVTSPMLSGLKFGILNSVSLGGFCYSECVCPLCDVPFDDKHCPHYIPDVACGINPGTDEVAPYFIRSGVYDLGELSLVLIPNVPNAGVLRKQDE